MGISRILTNSAVALACIGMLAAPLQASQPRSISRAIADVAIQASGAIEGQVLNVNGIQKAGAMVKVVSRGQVQAQVETDRNGRFRVDNLRGGIYQFQTDHGVTTARVWSQRTAPPAAAHELLIVEQGEVVRGIHHGPGHGGAIMNALSNPWVLAGLVALAIALPLALDDDNGSP